MLTQKRLKDVLTYDSSDGMFIWKIVRNRTAKAGNLAGTINSRGYRIIEVDGKKYAAHRLAWLYTYDDWPKKHIDHIDCNKLNNRISNLRLVTCAENGQNRIKANVTNKTSGLLGVSFHKASNKFRATIRINFRSVQLGVFNSKEEAHRAYLQAKSEFHLIAFGVGC